MQVQTPQPIIELFESQPLKHGRLSQTERYLLLFGGGPRSAAAIKQFFNRSGGAGHSTIMIITWASDEAEQSFGELSMEFLPHYPKAILSSLRPPETAQDKAQFLSQLNECTGIFFSGGDQNLIMDALQCHQLKNAIEHKYLSGTPVAGTSAGTAIMSSLMISGDIDPGALKRTAVQTRNGLGLLPNVIVDQHFLKRQRQNRLFSLVLEDNKTLGIGIDEGASLLVRDNRYAEVIGDEAVMFINPTKQQGSLTTDLLFTGDRYDLFVKTKLANSIWHFEAACTE